MNSKKNIAHVFHRNMPEQTIQQRHYPRPSLWGVPLCILIAGGCDINMKGSDSMDEMEFGVHEIPTEIISNIREAGYDDHDVDIDEEGKVILQGDIAISLAASRNLAGTQFRQATINDGWVVKSGAIYLRNGSCTFTKNTNFVEALEGARDMWNAQFDGLEILDWTPTSPPDRTITVVKSTSVGASQFAVADFPESRDEPGSKIRVNPATAGMSKERIQYVLTHEIGHALGMAHTDWDTRWSCKNGPDGEEDKFDIPGTTSCDPHSMMNSCPTEERTSFSDWDEYAIQCVFASCPSSVPTSSYDPAVDCRPN